MTILETLQQATDDAGFKGLSFANLQEFNAFMDSFTFLEYPRNVVVPYKLTGTFKGSLKKKFIRIQGWSLTRIVEDTNDWRSVLLEPQYIQPMRELAEKFILNVIDSDLTDPEMNDVQYSIDPEYMFLSSHLFGVSYTLNWPVTEFVC